MITFCQGHFYIALQIITYKPASIAEAAWDRKRRIHANKN